MGFCDTTSRTFNFGVISPPTWLWPVFESEGTSFLCCLCVLVLEPPLTRQRLLLAQVLGSLLGVPQNHVVLVVSVGLLFQVVFFFFFFKSTQPCLGLNAGAAQCREQTRVVVCKAKCLSPGLSGPSFRTLFSEVY